MGKREDNAESKRRDAVVKDIWRKVQDVGSWRGIFNTVVPACQIRDELEALRECCGKVSGEAGFLLVYLIEGKERALKEVEGEVCGCSYCPRKVGIN